MAIRNLKLKIRFVSIFVVAAALSFIVINGRYMSANIEYYLTTRPKLLVSGDVKPTRPPITATNKPLPNSATITIPRIGISVPIVFGISEDIKHIYNALNRGVVHYSASSKPGLNGAATILGHSSDYIWKKNIYGSVFALLGKLQPGDRIIVEYSDGRQFTFAMKQAVVFIPFTADARIEKIQQTTAPTLVLLSCWPVGTDNKRIAIEATLVQ